MLFENALHGLASGLGNLGRIPSIAKMRDLLFGWKVNPDAFLTTFCETRQQGQHELTYADDPVPGLDS
jgi:hypothetical protein